MDNGCKCCYFFSAIHRYIYKFVHIINIVNIINVIIFIFLYTYAYI